MADSNPHDITLRLDDIRHLFHAPELDPFAGRENPRSGIDQILNEIKPTSLRRPLFATIFLPQAQVSENTEAACREAIRRYCQARIRESENEITSARWYGIKALQTGLLFLATCLLLSGLLDGLSVLPEFLRHFLGEGFMIAGWVSLWHPTELLLYEWWPHSREKRLYEHIRDMELRILAGG